MQRYLTPKEQQIEALETRAAALEASVRQLESQAVSRLLLWPGKTAAELYRPGAGTPESRSLDCLLYTSAPATAGGGKEWVLREKYGLS